MVKRIPVLLFLIVCPLFGQQEPVPGENAALQLNIVFPEPGDTLDFQRIRFAASVHPDARVSVNGSKQRVYPSGAVVGMVNLDYGWNTITFEARAGAEVEARTVQVFRTPVMLNFPAEPTAVEAEEIQPANDIYVTPGDPMNVSFRGSPGGFASFWIEGLERPISMKEMPRKQVGGRNGIYKGQVVIPENWEANGPRKIDFRFRGRDNHSFRFSAPGNLILLSKLTPTIAVTKDSANFVLSEPKGSVLLELPTGLRLQVVGLENGLSKVRLARNMEGYISSSSLHFLPEGAEHPYASIGDIRGEEQADFVILKMKISERVPFQIEQSIHSHYLEISFFRALRAKQWIFYPPEDETVKRITTRHENGDVLKLKIHLNQKQQWGYDAQYVGAEFWLSIRRTPALTDDPDKPLQGLVFAVDAGHGGETDGVVGATGLAEKTVNLYFANQVQRLLQHKGAKAIMTRESDSDVSLQSRVRIARQHKAHIFLSLHNNSIGPQVDPIRPNGTAVYFTTPQSENIAKGIYSQTSILGLKPFGRIAAPFVVTRQTEFISCLVEGAFLTHPEDEMLLRDPKFVEEMAGAVVKGVVEFVQKQVPESFKFYGLEARNSRVRSFDKSSL